MTQICHSQWIITMLSSWSGPFSVTTHIILMQYLLALNWHQGTEHLYLHSSKCGGYRNVETTDRTLTWLIWEWVWQLNIKLHVVSNPLPVQCMNLQDSLYCRFVHEYYILAWLYMIYCRINTCVHNLLLISMSMIMRQKKVFFKLWHTLSMKILWYFNMFKRVCGH